MKREIFTTTHFLAICILIAISALLGLIGGSIDVFSVLLAISFWMLYSNAKNGKELSGFGLGIGTVKAMWIVGWVFAGIFAVVGLMLMFIPSSVVASAVDFSVDITGPESEELLDTILNFFGQHGMIWLGLAFLLVAVLVAVINFLFNRRFCVFTESLRDCTVPYGSGIWMITGWKISSLKMLLPTTIPGIPDFKPPAFLPAEFFWVELFKK